VTLIEVATKVVAETKTAPNEAEFPVMVEFVSVSEPNPRKIPPPALWAELSEIVQPFIATEPLIS